MKKQLSPVKSVALALSLMLGILVADVANLHNLTTAGAQRGSTPVAAARVVGERIAAQYVLVNGKVVSGVFAGSVEVVDAVVYGAPRGRSGVHVSDVSSSVTGVHVSDNSSSVTGVHVSDNSSSVTGVHVSDNSSSVTGVHVSDNSSSVTGVHVSDVSSSGVHVSDVSYTIVGGVVEGDDVQVVDGVITGTNLRVVGAVVNGDPAGLVY